LVIGEWVVGEGLFSSYYFPLGLWRQNLSM
jgi:hypothetical protein